MFNAKTKPPETQTKQVPPLTALASVSWLSPSAQLRGGQAITGGQPLTQTCINKVCVYFSLGAGPWQKPDTHFLRIKGGSNPNFWVERGAPPWGSSSVKIRRACYLQYLRVLGAQYWAGAGRHLTTYSPIDLKPEGLRGTEKDSPGACLCVLCSLLPEEDPAPLKLSCMCIFLV